VAPRIAIVVRSAARDGALIGRMDIRFGEHASFHRAAVGMVGGSLLLGLALHPVTSLAPFVGGIGGIALGASLGYGKTPWRLLAAVAASVPLFAMAPSWTTLTLVASVLALGLVVGMTGLRGLVTLALAGVTTLVAMWCAVRFSHARAFTSWPAWTVDGLSAMAMGMVGILAVLPRHLAMSRDPVLAAARQLPTGIDGEVRQLCDRSLKIWSTAKTDLADGDPGRSLIRDGVLKTLEVAAKTVEVKQPGASEQELASRIGLLDARIAQASDAETRAQYQAARAAIEDQQRYRDNIRRGRERLVARMHNHIAALEKFHLAATGLENAVKVTAKDSPTVKQLDELSHEVTASCDALAELESTEVAKAPTEVATAPTAANEPSAASTPAGEAPTAATGDAPVAATTN
jgi:hypothetical protein